jgi:hypothetical protein
MPAPHTACSRAFLDALSRKFARQDILLVQDGAPNHRAGGLVLPCNLAISRLSTRRLTRHNSTRRILRLAQDPWDEIRAKIFKTRALNSTGAARAMLRQAVLSIERNP